MRSRSTAVSIALLLGFGTATCADESPAGRSPLGKTVAIPNADPTGDSSTASPSTEPVSSTDDPDSTEADGSSADADSSAADASELASRPSSPPSTEEQTASAAADGDASTASDSGTAADSPAESSSDGPKSAAGPYNVGVMTTTLRDSDRPLTVEVWFPLSDLVDVADLPTRRYSLLDDVYYDSPNAYSAFSKFIATDQKFPLVVYSHGSGGTRFIDSEFAEAIASHGYVVASTDHIGNTATDMLAGVDTPITEIMLNRPNDVRRVIDALTGVSGVVTSDKIGPIVDMVDTEHIAVSGHSIGGTTAISLVTGFETDSGTDEPDDRVGAVVLMAPAVEGIFSDDQLADLDVPMIVVTGTDDRTTPVEDNADRLWAATTNEPAYEVELIGAEHNTFTDVCAYQASFATRPEVPKLITSTVDRYALEGCAEDDMNIDWAHDLTEMYVVGFLDEVFRDVPPIDPASAPDDVTIEARP